MKPGTLDFVIKVITGVLAFIACASYAALLTGLFIESVDNAKIFEIIGPTLNTTVSGFIAILSALKMVDALKGKE